MVLTPSAISHLYKLLPHKYRSKLIWANVNVFIIAIIDLISLGVLLPILLLVLDEDNIAQNHYFSIIYKAGGFESNQAFIGFVCFVVFLISLGRTLLNTYIQYNQNKRLYEISNYLSLRLYQLYYSKGYIYIKQNSSHRLINQINAVTSNMIQGYYIPFTSLICESLVIISILIGLVVFNTYVFLLVFLTFVPLSLIYYRYSRNRIQKYGELLFKLAPEKNKLLQQTFVGYTDMEMNNSFISCKKKYENLLEKQNFYSIRNAILNTSLQRVLEFAVICSIIVLIVSAQILTLPSLGMIIGIFTIAVYRILPGIIKGTSYYFTMRSNTFTLKILNEMREAETIKKEITQKEITFNKNIRFDSVCFSYDKTIPVIKNISFEINKGDFIGIRGESGSGKSTLFHLLLGFIKPDSGAIYIDDVSLSTEYIDSWHNKIGYVSQQLFMTEGTIKENIIMGSNISPNETKMDEILKLASLDKFVSSLPKGVETIIGEGGCLLSGGQRQRLGIARALYKNAEILLFDEATSSLDEDTEKAINSAILSLADQRRDLTMLVISHRIESLSICRKIMNLNELQN